MRRFPAEWEPQSAVMLTWPHAATDWADQLDQAQALYAELTALITGFEPVLVVVPDHPHLEQARARLSAAGADAARVRLAVAPSNDTWARDHGPITVFGDSDEPIVLDFRFNGWGGKFDAELDTCITRRLAEAGVFQHCVHEPVDLVLEGGAIETDGCGTLLAVTRTLIDPLRNPGLSRGEIEAKLRAKLGVSHFLWLTHGAISGDDTDGHIDTLARFCDPRTICYTRCDDPRDADYAELDAMESELRALRDAQGEPYRLIPLPSPDPVCGPHGERLPAGYANFLIINGAVVVPVYGNSADQRAMEVIAELFPSREILSLDCSPLIRQGGSLHCISMQLPAGVLDPAPG